ncbi:MAG: hypothetical protein A2381_05805 [Bdellovibrionales bacterium RIFOXYB1_FULL_37_110]|nr:MAG: hypothetical protein A2417_04690 [Bdellovibrionales bacterium RIFOXYC1_FULL_37_79]OFZ59336.1 MAG: hypothetical protein A2381_05805 [Bdellovibrionales bacterium RIFOXYB1_FULL_37_110]OFZ61896.1 MAG: hypothetical protein A2577_17690 [Bdellovibrionales bacterium RIFOXYD1_FULL_36_51]
MGKYLFSFSLILALNIMVQVMASEDCPVSTIEKTHALAKKTLSKHLIKLIEAQKDLKKLYDFQVKYDDTWIKFSRAERILQKAKDDKENCTGRSISWVCEDETALSLEKVQQEYSLRQSEYHLAKFDLNKSLSPFMEKYCKQGGSAEFGNYFGEEMFSHNHVPGGLLAHEDSVLSVFQSAKWVEGLKNYAETKGGIGIHQYENMKARFIRLGTSSKAGVYVHVDQTSQQLLSNEDKEMFDKIAGLVTVPRTRALIDDYIESLKDYSKVRAVQSFCEVDSRIKSFGTNPTTGRRDESPRGRLPAKSKSELDSNDPQQNAPHKVQGM